MNRIKAKFDVLKQEGRTALISYTAAGDPDYDTSLAVMKGLPEAGVDLIELGMPFSDPVAEGPIIQKAVERALAAGATMKKTLDMVKEFRAEDETTPIVLMGYANPLYAYGLEDFVKDCKDAGVDGFLIVDLPPEENGLLVQESKKHGLDVIHLATPTTDEARLDIILENAGGFLYCVSIAGVTGTAKADLDELKPRMEFLKSKANLPVAIGFGIKTPDDARTMSAMSDAVVVGSAIVEKVHNPADALAFVKSLSDALKS